MRNPKIPDLRFTRGAGERIWHSTAAALLASGNQAEDIGSDLIPLSDCDMYFHAGNYAGGASWPNWASTGANMAATISGALTSGTSNHMVTGVPYVSISGNSYVYLNDTSGYYNVQPGNAYTYEILMPYFASASGQYYSFGGRNSTGEFGGFNCQIVSTLSITANVYQNNSTTAWMKTISGTSAQLVTTLRPLLWTVVIDCATPSLQCYLNGVELFAGTTAPWPNGITTGTMGSSISTVGILGLRLNGGNSQALGSGTQVYKYMRHRRAFTPTQIAQRATWYNANRGY